MIEVDARGRLGVLDRLRGPSLLPAMCVSVRQLLGISGTPSALVIARMPRMRDLGPGYRGRGMGPVGLSGLAGDNTPGW